MDESTNASTASTMVAEAPPAAAPPEGPPSGAVAPGAPSPKKRRKGCLIALAVVVVLVLCAVIGIALVIGQLSKPADTGVVYSEADFDKVIAKVGVVWPELPEGADPDDYERVYSGQKPLDVTLTEAELSALMSYRHGSSYWPIKSMQVDLTGGNTARIAAVVTYSGRDWAVSASGSGAIAGSALDVEVGSAEVAGIDVPAEYLPLGADFLEGIVNPRLQRIPGFSIDMFEVTDEGVHLVGTTWETAEYVEVP